MTDDQKYKEILREIAERIKTDEILRYRRNIEMSFGRTHRKTY